MSFNFSEDETIPQFQITARHGEIFGTGKLVANAQKSLIKKAKAADENANALIKMVIYETEKNYFVMTGELVTTSPDNP
jgi:hypothetical protein